jgi:hypothetical protein
VTIMIWTLRMLSEQERHLLEMLDHAGLRGIPEALVLARGFDIELLSNLVRDGLATIATETVRADNHSLAVANVSITEAGQQALED